MGEIHLTLRCTSYQPYLCGGNLNLVLQYHFILNRQRHIGATDAATEYPQRWGSSQSNKQTNKPPQKMMITIISTTNLKEFKTVLPICDACQR